ncbi:MAG: glycerol kinase GlpK [Lachnospiraceae bacterium]|nr:glycerol kinase GlpK [Lachnospiraceae bacterium]
MGNYVMAFDAGTTSERAIIFDRSGRIVSLAQKEIKQYYPQAGWVEHDPVELWSAQLGVAVEAMSKAGIGAEDIEAIGITNQRETTIVWDKESGLPVCNAIVWQCRRTTKLCEELAPYKDMKREKTGLVIDPYFSATKLKWILDHVEGAAEKAEQGKLLFGTVESWLIWKLTKGRVHVTDYSNASRTMLFNIHELKWDEEICALLGIPMGMLPEPVPNSTVYGESDPAFLGGAVKIAGAAGDQQAALFGQKCFRPGDIKNTYGTGCFLLMNTGEKAVMSKSGLVTTIGWGINGKLVYALEGSVFMGGAVVQWLRDEMGMLSTAAESEKLAQKVEDTNGCYIVPAFTGLGAPYWKPEAKGIITGLSRGVGRYHIIRAALEAIAYQVNDIIMAMAQDADEALTELKVDGGASSNGFLCRTQADISNVKVVRPECVETTALGAAYLAGLAVGFWKDEADIESSGGKCDCFEPHMDEAERKQRTDGWRAAVAFLTEDRGTVPLSC